MQSCELEGFYKHASLSGHELASGVQASQDYNPADRSVINRGGIFGEGVCVTASGSYEPVVRTFSETIPCCELPLHTPFCQGQRHLQSTARS